jgi:hypothetical protein
MAEIAKIERFWRDFDPADFELKEADGTTKNDPDVEHLRQTEKQSREAVRAGMLKHIGLQKKALRTLFQGKIKPKIMVVLEQASAVVKDAVAHVDNANAELKTKLAGLQTDEMRVAHEDFAKAVDEFEKDWQTIHEFAEALRNRKKRSEADLPPVTRKLLKGVAE